MIDLVHITKNFGEKTVIRDISATIARGEVFTIIGPSGQGKSTLLRLINLLDTPSSGQVLFEGNDIHADRRNVLAVRRRMGMVFQKPAVFNTTVYDNIACGLRFRGADRALIDERVTDSLEVIGLADFAKRRARTLSGGEMQRVALARAMVTKPDILLLDEPTANLDPIATEKIEELVLHYNKEYGTTVMMATHDMLQGQRLADRIAVMMHGTFYQVGSPREIFTEPNNKEVARFIGIENIIEGTITKSENGVAVIDTGTVQVHAVSDLPEGMRVCGCIRPEDITIHLSHAKRISALNVFEGTIVRMLSLGPLSRIVVDCGIELVVVITWKSVEELGLAVGDAVRLSFKASAIHAMADNEYSD
jgi:tungstate transport system ATP-binding protein